ncbi:MAG: NAD(P)-binding domain-containing protein [Ardenticatenaceae bacterium]|nr:NAD(P)-binding domain-containing protein [Ardenticatenaceae bacterium]
MQRTILVVDPDGSLQRVLEGTSIPTGWRLTVLRSTDSGELRPALAESEVLVVKTAPVSRADLEAAPRLRLIQKFGRRTENIDLDAARERRVRVETMPLEHGVWVAEQAIMLLLALTKKLLPGHLGVIAGENPGRIEPFRTSQTHSTYNWTGLGGRGTLFRRTLGIVGLGEIGTEVARRAKAFDMEILYYNPPALRLRAEAEQELAVTYQPLEQLLLRSDYVTLHIPHTGETEALFGEHQFALMKPSAYFINCSRGGVVDERALCRALATRQIAGAGLDVFEFEPLPRDSELLRLENVVLTPHNAGGPLETIAGEGRQLIERIAHSLATCNR